MNQRTVTEHGRAFLVKLFDQITRRGKFRNIISSVFLIITEQAYHLVWQLLSRLILHMTKTQHFGHFRSFIFNF